MEIDSFFDEIGMNKYKCLNNTGVKMSQRYRLCDIFVIYKGALPNGSYARKVHKGIILTYETEMPGKTVLKTILFMMGGDADQTREKREKKAR